MTELVSTAEAARALGINRATVARLVARNELPAAAKAPGIRGAYLFHPDTIHAYRRGERPLPQDNDDADAANVAAHEAGLPYDDEADR